MITRENIREVLSLIDKNQLEQFYMDKTTDHYLLSLHVFNDNSYATLDPFTMALTMSMFKMMLQVMDLLY